MRTPHTGARFSNWRRHRFLLVATTVAIVVVAGLIFQLSGPSGVVFGAFLGPTTITIDGSFSDWVTGGSPASGIARSQDASNDGDQDANANFAGQASDIDFIWIGMSTASGGATVPSSGNLIQNFYFRIDTLSGNAALDQNFNIQLNLGAANPGFADHLLQVRPGDVGDSPEVEIVLFQYDTFPTIGAFTTPNITAKVANISGHGVLDTNATGAIGQLASTDYGFEIKIPVNWFTSTYGGSIEADGTGATSVVTALFSTTGSLGSVGTIKDTLNNADKTTTAATTSMTTGETSFVLLEPDKIVFTTSVQTLTAGTVSSTFTIQTQDELGPRAVDSNTTIDLTSDSATGKFSTAADGTFTTTLSVTITNGSNSANFFYKDTVSGSPTLTAAENPSSLGWTDGTQQQTVNPGALTSTNVEPETLTESRVGDVNVSFTLTNPLPADGKIVVTFPSGFTINSGGTTAIGGDGTNIDGGESVSVSGQVVTITRDNLGNEVTASTAVTIELTNIKNPTAGSSGTYSIKTTTSGDTAIDQDTSVTADTIAVDITRTSTATINDTFALEIPRTSTATLVDSFGLGLPRTSTATQGDASQSATAFGRTSTPTINDTFGLEIPRTSTATLGDSFGLGLPRTSTATLGDASQSVATFGRTSSATINDTFALEISQTSTATLGDSSDLDFPRDSTSTLGDAFQSAVAFSRTSLSTLGDTVQNDASFGRASAATLGDSFSLEVSRTSTPNLGDTAQSAVVSSRASPATLGDTSQNDVSLGRASGATLGDSLALGFPRTSTAAMSDSFSLEVTRTSRSTVDDTSQSAVVSSRASPATLGDTSQSDVSLGRASGATLGDSSSLNVDRQPDLDGHIR